MRWWRLRRGLQVEDLRSFGEAQSSSSTAQSSSGEAQSSSSTANRAGHRQIELQQGSSFINGCSSRQPKRCSRAGRSAVLPQLHSRGSCIAAPAPVFAPAPTQAPLARLAALPRRLQRRRHTGLRCRAGLLNGRRWKKGR